MTFLCKLLQSHRLGLSNTVAGSNSARRLTTCPAFDYKYTEPLPFLFIVLQQVLYKFFLAVSFISPE